MGSSPLPGWFIGQPLLGCSSLAEVPDGMGPRGRQGKAGFEAAKIIENAELMKFGNNSPRYRYYQDGGRRASAVNKHKERQDG